ncbi:MAG: DoxX family membrane protein [Pirellulales bacterium]|nr:DoxX family membrane protein [Pirellulales bacterium]
MAVVLLVALRVTIGWHFFYEGVWKVAHPDQFSATPFLTTAKGPAAPLFYAMVYDIDGRQRLMPEENDQGKKVITGKIYLDAWSAQQEAAVAKYSLDDKQQALAKTIYDQYADSVKLYLKENQAEIEGYFNSLDRFEQARWAGGNNTDFQKKRNWDEQQKLRAEVNVWLGDLDAMGDEYRSALEGLLTDEQKAQGAISVGLTRADLMDFAVTWSLTAIGFCLIVGFCNRLACLGGAAFLVSVLLTQPPWPTFYPPAPDVVGHALIVDKNFVEMVAMLALACLPVGRWGGLDAFVYRWFGQPLLKRFGWKGDE